MGGGVVGASENEKLKGCREPNHPDTEAYDLIFGGGVTGESGRE